MIDVATGDRDTLRERVVREFDAAARDAIAARGTFTVALSGGSIGPEFFPSLAGLRLDWTRTHFFWVDERAVAPSDPESNYGAADKLWFEPAAVPPASIHRMPADAPDLARAAGEYEAELRSVLGPGGRLDLVFLGMGPDGHVASLFPGHRGLDERDRLAIAIADSPKPPPRRLTLTLRVLTSARTIIVAAIGASKEGAFRSALEHEDSPLPVARMLHADGKVIALLAQ